MTELPITRATTLIPFVTFLEGIGAPVARELERARLPVSLVSQPRAHIPTRCAWAFLARMAERQGLDDLGLLVSLRSVREAMGPDLPESMLRAPALRGGLQIFCREAPRESSGMRCEIIPLGRTTCFTLRKTFGPETPGYRETEWLGVMSMIKAVRLFAGQEWQPEALSLMSPGPVPHLAQDAFPDALIEMGQPQVFMALSSDLLALPPPPCHRGPRQEESDPPRIDVSQDLVGSLRRLLPAYLHEGRPRIELIAEIAGVSLRSLQRELSASGVSYSSLLDESRVQLASRRLLETDPPILEIARSLGYTDASNFSRAFRRVTGRSPRAFRRDARARNEGVGLDDPSRGMN